MRKLELMGFHVDAAAAKAHTFGFQTEALLQGGIATQLDFTA